MSLIENAAGRIPPAVGNSATINIPELDERVRKSAERALNDPRLRTRLPNATERLETAAPGRSPVAATPEKRLPVWVVALVSCCIGAGTTYLAMHGATPPPVTQVAAPPLTEAKPPGAPVVRDEDAIQAMVQSWAAAWSQRDLETYLQFYSSGFTPGGGTEPDAWKRQRRERILGKRIIVVTASQVQVAMEGSLRARVLFRQSYAANGGRPQVESKELLLQREDAGWRIVAEAAAPGASR